MPHHAMITRNLLILVFRSLSTFPDQQPCAGSCFPSSQLPRSKHSKKLQQNPQELRVILSTVLLQSLSVFPRSSITLDCSNPVQCQTCHSEELSQRPPFPPRPGRTLNGSTRRSPPSPYPQRREANIWGRCKSNPISPHLRHPPPYGLRDQQ